ncbi:MAG: hypothetical protein CM1200mP2_16710 [Planctomycetaceae bacterium]|nr:MAG: hypothetical protein CM1200mP2_16710 [Planctomycetaceae bacterium]
MLQFVLSPHRLVEPDCSGQGQVRPRGRTRGCCPSGHPSAPARSQKRLATQLLAFVFQFHGRRSENRTSQPERITSREYVQICGSASNWKCTQPKTCRNDVASVAPTNQGTRFSAASSGVSVRWQNSPRPRRPSRKPMWNPTAISDGSPPQSLRPGSWPLDRPSPARWSPARLRTAGMPSVRAPLGTRIGVPSRRSVRSPGPLRRPGEFCSARSCSPARRDTTMKFIGNSAIAAPRITVPVPRNFWSWRSIHEPTEATASVKPASKAGRTVNRIRGTESQSQTDSRDARRLPSRCRPPGTSSPSATVGCGLAR